MRRIWVYQGDFGWGKDFRWTSLTEFRRSFSVQQAVGYLGAIQHALRRDAKEGYREGQFNISLRHAFAEIDGVAKLYCGERGKRDTAQHAVEFGEKYLGRVNPRYRELFGLVFNMYRHGLAHTHLTMCVRFRGGRHRWVTLGWGMSDDDCHRNRHLTIERRETQFFASGYTFLDSSMMRCRPSISMPLTRRSEGNDRGCFPGSSGGMRVRLPSWTSRAHRCPQHQIRERASGKNRSL